MERKANRRLNENGEHVTGLIRLQDSHLFPEIEAALMEPAGLWVHMTMADRTVGLTEWGPCESV